MYINVCIFLYLTKSLASGLLILNCKSIHMKTYISRQLFLKLQFWLFHVISMLCSASSYFHRTPQVLLKLTFPWKNSREPCNVLGSSDTNKIVSFQLVRTNLKSSVGGITRQIIKCFLIRQLSIGFYSFISADTQPWR